MKFVLTMALIVILFVCRNFYSLALGLVFVVATLLLSKVPMKMMWRSIKPLVILMLFTAVINVFYNRGGETLVSFWKITITTTGVYTAIFTTVRIILLVVVSSLLTYTTTPTMLTDALECRCYTGGEGRTRMKQMKLAARDFVALGVTAALLAAVIVLNHYLGHLI